MTQLQVSLVNSSKEDHRMIWGKDNPKLGRCLCNKNKKISNNKDTFSNISLRNLYNSKTLILKGICKTVNHINSAKIRIQIYKKEEIKEIQILIRNNKLQSNHFLQTQLSQMFLLRILSVLKRHQVVQLGTQ